MWDGILIQGRALLALGRVSEAAAAFSKAADLEPARAEPAYFVSFALEQLGRHDEALAYGRRAAACADAWPKLTAHVERLAAALGRA